MNLVAVQASLALGSALWGAVAAASGTRVALAASAAIMLLLQFVNRRVPVAMGNEADVTTGVQLPDLAIAVEPLPDDGPVLIQLDLSHRPRISATSFSRAIQRMEPIRRRNGATSWRVFRDLEQDGHFVERFIISSYAEYVRSRARMTHRTAKYRTAVDQLQSAHSADSDLALYRRGVVAAHEPGSGVMGDIDLGLLGVAAAVGFAASIVGGIAGYGTGLILPVFMAPIVGVKGVMPALAITMVVANGSRILAFRDALQLRLALRVMLGAVPAAFIGASFYAMLSERAIAIVLAVTLVLTIPLRRILAKLQFRLTDRGLVAGGAGFGFVAGATIGTGPILIAILLAGGVAPASIVATDAFVSLFVGLMRIGTFSGADLYTAPIVLTGLAIGLATVPGGFAAKWIVARIPIKLHTSIIEGVVLVGAILFIRKAVVG